MGLVTVDIPRKARPARASLTDEQLSEAVRRMRAGEAISPDDVLYEDRHNAQTEAWRWRHAIATFAGMNAGELKSTTFSDDGGASYKFAIYLATT